ncbi:hypothetical protein SAMN05216303_101902 [Rhodoferax sp. OV413]|uniref:hypothetical protein n=1 Tax=Rhodoferax sp. OV413 TaxID=1855285 RepID=UPI00088BA583|nr:hypothetical protein SAMN05216303_101902 [Rhodoferax sp. OV413]
MSAFVLCLVLMVVQTVPFSHVEPAREMSMLLSALPGEGQRSSRLLGAGCIAAGVAALALG